MKTEGPLYSKQDGGWGYPFAGMWYEISVSPEEWFAAISRPPEYRSEEFDRESQGTGV